MEPSPSNLMKLILVAGTFLLVYASQVNGPVTRLHVDPRPAGRMRRSGHAFVGSGQAAGYCEGGVCESKRPTLRSPPTPTVGARGGWGFGSGGSGGGYGSGGRYRNSPPPPGLYPGSSYGGGGFPGNPPSFYPGYGYGGIPGNPAPSFDSGFQIPSAPSPTSPYIGGTPTATSTHGATTP